MIGTSLSHYRIVDKLGQGGMGEVYRAEDSNLHRHVAVKVLPDEFAHDAERLARFQREAEVLASLNHPNIASVHGLEESGGKRFIVMELVEGETLAQRLLKGPLPVNDALEVCRQIAEGLEAAHEKGVIHRDLKPANVMITAEDKVKILDFGLAKALADEIRVVDVTHSPTITEAMTRPGVVLGTAAYMSPEQAKGKPVDKRTDIWGFGCVWYECLTGRRAFYGETITETLAAILKSEPDWTLLPANTPEMVRSLLRQCLQKDPARRLHDIADVRIEMQQEVGLPAAGTVPVRQLRLGYVIAACTLALVLGVLIGPAVMKYFRPSTSPVSQPVVRSPIRLEPGHWLDGSRQRLGQPTRTAMVISGDSRFVVYSALKENPDPQAKPRLYLRRFEQLEATPITGTEGGISPFLSPDGRWVGFWADGKLKKVAVDGGVPAALCDVPAPFGFSWGDDNQIVFAPGVRVGLSRISAEGGEPETLTTPDRAKEEWSHRLPHCLPAGKGILFTIVRNNADLQPRVAAIAPATRRWRVLLEDAADARYVPTGHLAFLRQGTLMLVPFDADKLEITGQPIPAIENVMQALNSGNSNSDTAAGQFSISASGSLVLAVGGILPDMQNSLVWVDQKGDAVPIASFKAPFLAPRLSPDGQHIAYQTLAKERQVWIYDLKRGTATKLTSDGIAYRVTWTPDSRRVVFGWSKTGISSMYWQPADGSSPMERLTASEYAQVPGSWSPDGEIMAFLQTHPAGGWDILLLQKRDSRTTPFLSTRFEERYPEFSRDGRWIAYASNESGRYEIYVQPFPGPGGRWQISSEGGTEPLWSWNGKQLLYRRPDQVWAADVQAGSVFSASKPRLVFERRGYGTGAPIRGWDISPDGRRFLMVKMEERKSQPVTEMILVQNWTEELKRLVPTGAK